MFIAFRNSYVFMYEVTVMILRFEYAIPAFTHYYYHLVCLFVTLLRSTAFSPLGVPV